MTREQLWKAYCDRNPSFAGDGEVTMKASGLKRLFEQTWELGSESGAFNERQRNLPSQNSASRNPFEELFKQYKK